MIAINKRIYNGRKRSNVFFLTLSTLAAVFGLIWLALILSTLFYKGFAGLSLKVFTEMTPPPGQDGGLANAIFGSVVMSLLAVAAGTPIGILAGTYLAEYGRYSKLADTVRFINDILLSAPSILIGLFIYVVIVATTHTFSAWAGAAALTVIVIPVVVRTTENMLLLVPNGLREAATALGAPRAMVIKAVTWRAARAGIVTGVLLAIARISGETAPLLLTVLSNQFWSTHLGGPVASLPVIIFNFAMSPYEDWHKLAWAGALLITIAVLTLSIFARLLESSKKQ
ncbi:phosphate transport system permease protein [Rhizomicrobium palustre]|uniref:Phosphate transport system permease protein PstA n=1 Tax=Rhizomicrobium palustre TaxID=189966 RepID=A0A846MYG5_9PROT|nr:phosphate ABC transporter permease PstA [Rhizomicrobium palustre]NIK88151.1 phosphate transport system permease protein [Rhizomicrobium palustre]